MFDDEILKLEEQLKALKKKKASSTEEEGGSSSKLRPKKAVVSSNLQSTRMVVCALCGTPKRLDEEVNE